MQEDRRTRKLELKDSCEKPQKRLPNPQLEKKDTIIQGCGKHSGWGGGEGTLLVIYFVIAVVRIFQKRKKGYNK
jgi:hypothetical protein